MRNLTVPLAAGLLAACATKLVYQRLDFFIGWRLNDYVTLDDRQQQDFKRTFGELWRWHRAHELPRYAQALRDVAKTLDGRPVTAAQVAERSAQFEAHWARLMDETITRVCPIVQTLDDAQARAILEGVDDDIEEWDPLESTCRHASLSIL